MPHWAQHLLALLALALVLGVVFAEIAWQGRVFAAADFEAPSHFAAAGRRALEAGQYPLWNPYIFMGMPSFGSLSFTPYVFPPSEMLRLLSNLPGYPPLGWLLFYYWAAGVGVWVLLRSLGCSFWPALLGAVLFMLTPHAVSWGVFGHGSKLGSVAFLPWLLWAALKLRHAPRPLVWSAVLALLVGLQLLRGHPQIAFYALLMLATFTAVECIAAVRARAQRPRTARFSAGMLGALLLGFGLSAVLLLPIRAYAPESIRGASTAGGADYTYATNWSQPPAEVITFALPSAAGFGEGTYVGAMPFTNFPHYLGQATLLFGAVALFLLRGRLLLFLITLALLALCVSFGKHVPFLYDLLYDHMPYFNKFRVPVMILILLQLAAVVTAGLGLAAMWGDRPRLVALRHRVGVATSTRVLLAGAVVAALLAIGAVVASGSIAARVESKTSLPPAARSAYAQVARDMLVRDGLRVALLLVAQAGVVAALWRRRLPADAAGAALLLLVVADLAAVDRRMMHPERTWPGLAPRIVAPSAVGTPPTPLFAALRQESGVAPTRVLPFGALFSNNDWMSHDVASVGGYHPAKLARIQGLLDRADLLYSNRVANLLSAQWFVTLEPLQNAPEPAYSGVDGVAYRNPGALPRARLVPRWRLTRADDCWAALADPQLDPAAYVLLESEPQTALDPQAEGEARVVLFSANRVEVEVRSSGPALLLLAEAYHSNWRARVNGEETQVLAADCLLRAVEVPSGNSSVVFEYVDPALRAGIGVTAASAVCVLLLLGFGVWRGRATAVVGMREPVAEASS
ncbi:MAG: YfhO family protein [Candidatus Latescibacterota bacterium]|nr:MAG: YfhO family protein [Candidatus Latescibacterota bacterium]